MNTNKRTKNVANNKKGFTLVELMIATAVFSTILLLATTGVINIGKLYYKGITTARTQEAARSIADEVSRSVQLTDGEIKGFSDEDSVYSAVCIGKNRYTYRVDDTKVSDVEASGDTVRGLWLDEITEGDDCQPSSLDNFSDGGRELLGNNMRLIEFEVSEQPEDRTKIDINVGVAYGENDLLTTYDDRGDYIAGADRGDAQCKSTNSGGSFCAVSKLETFVKRRFSVVYLN